MGFPEEVPLGLRKNKQELNRWRCGMRAGKGIPGRGNSSCKGPEVGKNAENAGDPKRTDVAAEIEGSTCAEGAGKVGRGQILWGPIGHGKDPVSILRAV